MIILTREAIAAIETSMNANGKSGFGVRVTAERRLLRPEIRHALRGGAGT